MNISVSITKKEFRKVLLKYVVRTNINTKRLIIAFIVFFLLSIQFGSLESKKIWYAFIYPLGGMLIYGLYFSPLFLIPLRKFVKTLDSNAYAASYDISVNSNGFVLSTRAGERTVPWREIITIKHIESYLLINLLDESIYIIPENSFNEEITVMDFIQSIQKGIHQTRGTLNVPLFLRPPYWLGILCFIPVLGIFIGIGYILLGLLLYKNKWMAIIGGLGIMFTFILYSVLFPQLWSKKESDKQFANLAQIQLNNLIRDIEFYKLQNGHYPQNLVQLKSSNAMVIIFDPLQIGNKLNSNFNYVLVGEKYRLFSSGIDRIPNTKDDIYPNIKDSSKTGFIK